MKHMSIRTLHYLTYLLVGLFAFSISAVASDFKWPQDLKIATPAVGSSAYTLILAWANKMEQSTGMKIRLLPENSIGAKWAGLKSKRFDMMNESSGTLGLFIIPGSTGYQTENGGPFDVRSFWIMQAQCFVVVVRGDSPVKTIRDLAKQGKDFRVVHWTVPAGYEALQAVVNWAGKRPEDFTIVQTGSYPGQVRMVAEGKADLAALALADAPVVMEAAAGPSGLRVLDLDEKADPAGARAYREILPVYSFPVVRSGPEHFIGLHGWGTATMLHTHADFDADLVYQMIKWWDENFESIKALHPSIKTDMTVEYNHQMFNQAFLPTHDGAIRFFKEKGLWTEANQRRQDYLVKLVSLYSEGYKKCIAQAKSEGVTIDPKDERWNAIWSGYKKAQNLPIFKIMTDEEIKEAWAKLP